MILGIFVIIFFLALGILFIPRLVTTYQARSHMFTIDEAPVVISASNPSKKVAVVFGVSC